MQEFKDRVSEIVRKYEEPLAAKGIRIAISKRNAETEVQERSDGYAYTGQAIMNTVDRAIDRKKEREKGYNNQRNRYHSIVITALPIDKKLVPRDRCREYAFVLRKVERAHLGEEPQKKIYNEDRVLSKIEKTILKILKKVGKSSVQKVCKDTFRDAIRYTCSPKYKYKNKFCGKERFTWEMIFLLSDVAIAIAVIAVACTVEVLF